LFPRNKVPFLRLTWSSSYQAFPDVSAQGWNFSFFYQGEEGLVGGTSAAAPTFSSFVSLLNDARVTAGLKPLGFLNPLLYSKGYQGLNDITSGNNPGCGTEGFNATVGWDPGKDDVLIVSGELLGWW
jgi:tripeptidyl-peptidase I